MESRIWTWKMTPRRFFPALWRLSRGKSNKFKAIKP
jgi:hypothetical protein